MSPLYCDIATAPAQTRPRSSFDPPSTTYVPSRDARDALNLVPLLSDTKHKVFDEEAQYDFWDPESTMDGDCGTLPESVHSRSGGIIDALYDFAELICVVALATSAVFLGIDLALGQIGVGQPLTNCIARHLNPHPQTHEVSPVRGDINP